MVSMAILEANSPVGGQEGYNFCRKHTSIKQTPGTGRRALPATKWTLEEVVWMMDAYPGRTRKAPV